MADGNNRRFISDPVSFTEENVYTFSTNEFLHNGIVDADFVSNGNKAFLLKDFNIGRHGLGAVPVHSYFLIAQLNNISAMVVQDDADFLFTPILTGCMFAVYSDDNISYTVEHVNAFDGTQRIPNRIAQIRTGGHAFYKILCESRDANAQAAADVNVYTYNHTTAAETMLVFAERTSGNWTFYKKLAEVDTPLTVM